MHVYKGWARHTRRRARAALLGSQRFMAPSHAAAYCCGRKGCGGYRFVYLTVANNEALECAKCGSAFPKRTHLLPLPRERRRDGSTGGKGKGKDNVKGKGQDTVKGKGKSTKGSKGYGKGNGHPSAPGDGRKGGAQATAAAKATPRPTATSGPKPAPWAREPTPSESIWIDMRRRDDPVYYSTLQVLLADKMQRPDRAAAARAVLAEDRAKFEADLPPERRLAHLRKRLKTAEMAKDKQEVRVRAAEEALVTANHTLQEARATLRERHKEVGEISGALEATELQIPPKAESVRPGPYPAGPVRREYEFPELLELAFQSFKPYVMDEARSHALESGLRNLELMRQHLQREQKARDAEEREGDDRAPPTKRGRASEEEEDADHMGDSAVGALVVPPTPTEVADNDAGDGVLEAAERTAQTLTERGVGSAEAAAATADSVQRAAVADPPVPAQLAPQHPEQANDAPPTHTMPTVRAQLRERSPRRDPPAPTGRVRWADQDVEDETPQLTAAQEAALRGDEGADSLDSLPVMEQETPQPPTSNQRGGGSLT